MAKKLPERVALKPIDSLFGTNQADVVDIPIKELYTFKDHPFKVLDDEKMEEMINSIRENGILNPLIVRKKDSGGYEMVSGHRRKHAAEILKLKTVPAIVKDMDDDEAIIAMVDTNLHREEILPSEKAYAYKMRLDAISHQGSSRRVGEKYSVEILADNGPDSARQIHRYIRLTALNKELLDFVDKKKLKFFPAVEISFLTDKEQEYLYNEIIETGVYPTLAQAEKIRALSRDKKCTQKAIHDILFVIQPVERKFSLNKTKIDKYFPADYTSRDIEKVIYKLLDEWKKVNN